RALGIFQVRDTPKHRSTLKTAKQLRTREQPLARKPLSARTFLTLNEEPVSPGKRRRIPRPFNAYEAWFCWVLPYLRTTDLRFCKMEEFPPRRPDPLANRLRRCVSSWGIRWRDLSCQRFRKKGLFLPGERRR